jgi:hypothetical protein
LGDVKANMGMKGDLDSQIIRAPRVHRIKDVLRTPFGRLVWTKDRGAGNILSDQVFLTHLAANHIGADGRLKRAYDLGSGLVTNVGVTAMANDWNWAAPSGAAINTIKLANQHATGTGGTAAAATDIKIQTISTNGGQNPVAGTQSIVTAANAQAYRTVATISYTGSEAVTEWGLFTNATLTATTGSPATSSTNGPPGTLTVTGTPLTASTSTVQGNQQFIVHDSVNATPFYGLVLSNTTSVFTVVAWYKVADGTSTSPGSVTDAYTIRPVMWDHKQFAAINVNSGDSIQFTYTLTINSGG